MNVLIAKNFFSTGISEEHNRCILINKQDISNEKSFGKKKLGMSQSGIKGLKSTFQINVFLFKLQESVTNLYSKKISR